MFGGVGADRLNGGKGNDSLFGQMGGDRLIGGPGNDLLDGGRIREGLCGNVFDSVADRGAGCVVDS